MALLRRRIFLVLRHDQVLARNGECLEASITQVDLHDFSRLCQTFDLGGFFCVSALPSQHQISRHILAYWREGPGKEYNPDRNQALTQLRLCSNFEEVVAMVTDSCQAPPFILGTSAQDQGEKTVDFDRVPAMMADSGRPLLVLFGTSWGLSQRQLQRCDGVLPPVVGPTAYNHLSVRCAAAILTDRLLAHINPFQEKKNHADPARTRKESHH
jgi:hypothetical protein